MHSDRGADEDGGAPLSIPLQSLYLKPKSCGRKKGRLPLIFLLRYIGVF